LKSKFQSTLLLLFTTSVLLISPVIHAAQLTITVENIQALKGKLYISIFSDAESYANETEAVRELEVAVDSSAHTIVVDDLFDGEYAIKIVHDENDNGKFDTNFMGIPKEGYGFSNNGGRFGPPKFEKAMFVLGDNKHIHIKLH